MSAAVATETTTTGDPFDALTPEMFATPDTAPVSETATRESEPTQESEEAAEQDATPDTPRDGSGRYAAKGEGEPTDAGAAPAEAAKPAEPDLTQTIAELQRRLATANGQVDNAAKQAAAQTEARVRAEERAAAETRVREDTKQELQRQIHSGELTYDQANAIWTRKQGEWEQADRQAQTQQDNQRRAGLMLTEVETGGQQKLLTLYQHGAQVLAEDTGLGIDDVRALWADQEERERFLRASMQSEMASKLPGVGFNAQALNDYMATMVGTAKQIAALKTSHTTALAAKDKEIARLQQQLNRDEADTEALRGPEAPARGGTGRRAARDPDERARQVLTENVGELVRAWG